MQKSFLACQPRSFSCIECHKSYGSDYLLTTHMKTHNDRIYNCDDCDRKFQRLDILVDHRKRHTNERTQLCPTCGKAFVDLERHTRTHTKEPAMHQCIICGKIMSHSNNLLIHMRAHKNRTSPLIAESNGTKTILCSVCGRSCSSRSNLAVHMRRHSGEMTNFCLVCGKGYPRSTDLKIHMRYIILLLLHLENNTHSYNCLLSTENIPARSHSVAKYVCDALLDPTNLQFICESIPVKSHTFACIVVGRMLSQMI